MLDSFRRKILAKQTGLGFYSWMQQLEIICPKLESGAGGQGHPARPPQLGKTVRSVDARRASWKKWAAKNREHLRTRNRVYKLQNREKCLSKQREYNERNKKKKNANNKQWRIKNKVRRDAYMRDWWSKNQFRKKGYDARRRAKRRLREGQALVCDKFVDITISKWKQETSFKCYWCKNTFGIERLHVDHVIPLCQNGKHATSNICKSCDTCNHRKKEKLPHQIEFLSQACLSL